MGRRTDRVLAEAVLECAAPLPEPLAVEEPGRIEALDDVGDVLEGRGLAVPALQDLPDLRDRMLPIEERYQVQQGRREHGDLIGEAGRISQRHAAPPLLLDREGLEGPELRVARAGHSASR